MVLRKDPNITHGDKNFRDVQGTGANSDFPWQADYPVPASVGAETFPACCRGTSLCRQKRPT